MLKAIIFDCDGVIADTEPLHLAAFQRTLAEEGIALTEQQYLREYLALDDRGCFMKAFANNGRDLTQEKLSALIERKAAYIAPAMQSHLRIFPGVSELIRQASAHYPLAVASGALRHEVEMVLTGACVRECFDVIVAAEDVAQSKPHPEPFMKARDLINSARGEAIEPRECLVIEDSLHGIEAAHLAGMLCLAVANSYPKQQLSSAELAVETLAGISLKDLERLFDRSKQ